MRRLLPATAAAALMLSLLGSVPAMASAHHGPAASLDRCSCHAPGHHPGHVAGKVQLGLAEAAGLER